MAEEKDEALTYALRLLSRRLHSRAEIEAKLKERGSTDEIIQHTIAWLQKNGYVNDQRFAEAYVHSRDQLKPRGEFMLRLELAQKGVSESDISAVLQERKEEGAVDEEAQARRLLAAKERQYARLDQNTRKRRQIALLGRHGFSTEVIRRILNV
jgi:regulatory protein